MNGSDITTRKMALDILGEDRFFPKNLVIKKWRELMLTRDISPEIENTAGKETPILLPKNLIEEISLKKMWRLIFDPGFSLCEMRNILGRRRDDDGLSFYRTNKWWLGSKCASERRIPGYHLIRVRPYFSGISWAEQEEKIGDSLCRASTSLMVSVLISVFLIKRICLLNNLDHWGVEGDQETKIAIGVRQGSIFLYGRRHNWPCSLIGVCVEKK